MSDESDSVDERNPINGQPWNIQKQLRALTEALGVKDYAAVRHLEITPRRVVIHIAQRDERGQKLLAPDYGLLVSEHTLAVIT